MSPARVAWVALLLAAAVVGAGACSLNPQPIPPGFDDPAADAKFGSDGGAVPPPNSTGVSGGGADAASTRSDGSVMATPDGGLPFDDGGSLFNDAGGSTDASPDAPADASTDAPSTG